MIYQLKQLIMDNAPEEEYEIEGKSVIVRRDDLAYNAPLPPNAKMSALYELVKRASEQGYTKVVMFAKKQQGVSYAIGLPVFCKMFGLQAYITYPQPKSQWDFPPIALASLKENGFGDITNLIPLHPNMVTINVNQSKKLADKLGAYFIPFGFDDALSVRVHADKFSLPDYVGTLVMSTMTGMILAGTLRQIHERGYKVGKVIAVSGGRPVESVFTSMNKYIGDLYEYGNQLDNLEVINPYGRNDKVLIPDTHNLFPTHPDYERKAWLWLIEHIRQLEEPIYFLNVGR